MNTPLISVIVPVYKVEAYLDRCVQSIVDQTYQNLEIILVDDGSPDNCPAMCDAWAAKDSRIKVIHKENGGLSDARNVGMAVAAGEYISFLDSDDWVDIHFLQVLYDLIVRTNADIAECRFVTTFGESSLPTFSEEITVCTPEEALVRHIQMTMFKQVVWNKLYRKNIINVQFEKGKCHEDEFWTYQIIANCKRLAHIEKALYFYFQRADSIMGAAYSIKRLDVIEAKVNRNDFLKKHYPHLFQVSDVDICFTCFYHGQLVLKHMKHNQLKQAFVKIERFYPRDIVIDRKKLTLTHFLWLKLAQINLPFCCWIRNLLGIGL